MQKMKYILKEVKTANCIFSSTCLTHFYARYLGAIFLLLKPQGSSIHPAIKSSFFIVHHISETSWQARNCPSGFYPLLVDKILIMF